MNPFQKKQGAPPALSTPGAKTMKEAPLPEQPEPTATEQGKVVISPEMVAFRTADETCANCSHYGQGGQCSVLNMNVESGDSCNAFSEREDGASDIEGPGEEIPAAV